MFNKSIIPMTCRKFEPRFEDYLDGVLDTELDEHLAGCERCRSVMEDARLAGSLVRQLREPAREANEAFMADLMGRIQKEEGRAAFWTPLESLASRLSLTAAVVLLALSFYLLKFPLLPNAPSTAARTESLTSYFPQPPVDPVSNEDVLQSLAENNYGR